MQYMTFEHEDGIQALGQELTAFGWCLYDFDEEDEHLFILLSDKEKAAFEQQCRKADHYFKLMKQRGRAFGQAAKEQPTQPLMPCNDTYFPQDAYYTIQTIAGNFASGIWIAKDEIQQGKFVADLRERPLKPIKVKLGRISWLYLFPEIRLLCRYLYYKVCSNDNWWKGCGKC